MMSVVVGLANSGDRSALAGSMATIAIACLGGPIAGGSAALGELVKLAQARYQRNSPARELHRQVTAGIQVWAASQRLGPEVDLGLDLAVSTIAEHGMDTAGIAEALFDPATVTRCVVASAKATDPLWGTEAHYAVAERAIAETYAHLVEHLRDQEPVMIPVIQELRDALDHRLTTLAGEAKRTRSDLGDLAGAMTAPAAVTEVMAYLKARIEDWDVSVWRSGPAPSNPRQIAALP